MSKELCIFGEVLFDHFPDGSHVLGGAPFNVAWHLQAFSQAPRFISRIGNDPQGEAVRTSMTDWSMDTQFLQTDDQLATGKVSVSIEDGEPEYDIVYPCAYDAIQNLPDLCDCDFLYHGSLALRNEQSLSTLTQLLNSKPETIFVDVNLRAPWYSIIQVQQLLSTANWVKLNTDELNLLATTSSSKQTDTEIFMKRYHLDGLILTHGSKGAEVITAEGEYRHIEPDHDIEIIDTVGAGDAFASIMILGLRNNWPLDTTLQRAQSFASSIVSNRGATISSIGFYQSFIQQWNFTV